MAERVPLIIDCDTGIDDAVALLYACGSPEAELLGATCVPGNVSLEDVARNTLAVLELAGRSDVEVAPGRERPLVRPLRIAPETHGPHGLGYAVPAAPRASPSGRTAADLIVEVTLERPEEVTLVTIGPLTNLALALLRDPELPSRVRRLVMMVGAYRAAGNTAPTTEWNASVDPEALAIVIEAWERAAAADGSVPRPVALGLDVTERAKMTPEHLGRLDERSGDPDGPIVRFVRDALRFYFEFHSRYDGFYGAFIHDALAVAVALDPSLGRSEALAVQVELAGRLTAGETVTDWRRTWDRAPNVDIVVEADVGAFFERLVERVGGLAASRPA
jgi:purine nucleosidase